MISVKDNILSESIISGLSKKVSQSDMPWYFQVDSAFNIDKANKLHKNYSFSHGIFKDGQTTSNLSNLFYQSTLLIMQSFNIDINKKTITRLRLGMTTSYGEEIINKPHTDLVNEEHEVILLYLNDSDGDTYFYEDEKIIKQVTPKLNRAVYFDGKILHSSSKPTNNTYRIVLNVNIKDKL